MGYTHYWTTRADATDEAHIGVLHVAKKIVELAQARGVKLDAGDAVGNGPCVTATGIYLNGAAPDDYETFAWTGRGGFAFCKTARKPYDVVVTAILCCMDHVGVADVRSDGDANDWAAGLALAREACGLPGVISRWSGLTVPKRVREA